MSAITVRVCGLLTYVVLKILAFQDRHDNKDAYDLVFCLLNFGDGPEAAGGAAATSPVASHPQVADSLRLLGERFADAEHDGPASDAAFLAGPGDVDNAARLRREAVAVVRTFLDSFRAASG